MKNSKNLKILMMLSLAMGVINTNAITAMRPEKEEIAEMEESVDSFMSDHIANQIKKTAFKGLFEPQQTFTQLENALKQQLTGLGKDPAAEETNNIIKKEASKISIDFDKLYEGFEEGSEDSVLNATINTIKRVVPTMSQLNKETDPMDVEEQKKLLAQQIKYTMKLFNAITHETFITQKGVIEKPKKADVDKLKEELSKLNIKDMETQGLPQLKVQLAGLLGTGNQQSYLGRNEILGSPTFTALAIHLVIIQMMTKTMAADYVQPIQLKTFLPNPEKGGKKDDAGQQAKDAVELKTKAVVDILAQTNLEAVITADIVNKKLNACTYPDMGKLNETMITAADTIKRLSNEEDIFQHVQDITAMLLFKTLKTPGIDATKEIKELITEEITGGWKNAFTQENTPGGVKNQALLYVKNIADSFQKTYRLF